MARFFRALQRGLRATAGRPTGEPYTVAGHAVQCPHCASHRFIEGRAQLNTAGLTFLNLDWANRTAATLTCAQCGRIEWYLEDPEEAD